MERRRSLAAVGFISRLVLSADSEERRWEVGGGSNFPSSVSWSKEMCLRGRRNNGNRQFIPICFALIHLSRSLLLRNPALSNLYTPPTHSSWPLAWANCMLKARLEEAGGKIPGTLLRISSRRSCAIVSWRSELMQ